METSERSSHLEILRETPNKLKAALAGVPKKVLAWTPAPGKWSIHEIVCHMRDMERDAYQARYQRMLSEENPLLPDINGEAYAIERDYRSQKLSEALRDLNRLRKENLKLLKSLKTVQWLRAGIHETAGPLTVEVLLRRQAIGNDVAHLGQIESIKKRYDVLTKLEAAPGMLHAVARTMTSEQAGRQPAPDKWSIVEIACHLRDIEELFGLRLTQAAHQERPEFWIADNDRLASARKYAKTDFASAAREFKKHRESTLTLLRALPASAWQRKGIHPKRGEVSIEELAQILVSHDENHLAQIDRLRQAAPAGVATHG